MEKVDNQRYLLVGLGNPGVKYQQTRHNVGFMFLDFLVAEYRGDSFKMEQEFNGEVSRCAIAGHDCLLLKPQTFMNLSGESVVKLAAYYKIKPNQIVIFYDDLDLQLGRIRLRTKSGDGGHNGIRSIKQMLATNEYINFRFGIGRPENGSFEISSWVLSKLQGEDRKILEESFKSALVGLEALLSKGLTHAQNKISCEL